MGVMGVIGDMGDMGDICGIPRAMEKPLEILAERESLRSGG
jgi:hypothetical protein